MFPKRVSSNFCKRWKNGHLEVLSGELSPYADLSGAPYPFQVACTKGVGESEFTAN